MLVCKIPLNSRNSYKKFFLKCDMTGFAKYLNNMKQNENITKNKQFIICPKSVREWKIIFQNQNLRKINFCSIFLDWKDWGAPVLSWNTDLFYNIDMRRYFSYQTYTIKKKNKKKYSRMQ